MDASRVCSVSDRSERADAGADTGEDVGAGGAGAGMDLAEEDSVTESAVTEGWATEDLVTAGLAGIIGLAGKGDLEARRR
jgi:hypothetical protein